jgi:uncharacterized protein
VEQDTLINKSSFAYKFSKQFVDHPVRYLTLSFLLLFIVLPSVFSIQSKWSPRIWFDPDHSKISKLDKFEQQFGSDQFIALGVYHPKTVFNEESLQTVLNLTEDFWLVRDIIRVESLSNYNYIQAEGDEILTEPFIPDESNMDKKSLAIWEKRALNDETLPDFFISRDKTFTLLYGHLKPSLDREPDYTGAVSDVRKLAKKYQSKNIQILILGPAAANDAFREISGDDNTKLVPFMIFFLLLLLYIQFRSWATMFLPLFLISLTIGITYGIMGFLGIIYNSLISAIPGVLLAICLADAVHIFTSYFHYRNEKYNSLESTLFSLTKNFRPTLLTSVSTAISFLSITQTELAPVRDLGLLCGIGTVLAWILTYSMLGSTLALLSSRLDKRPPKSLQWDSLIRNSKESNFQASKIFVPYINKFKIPIIIIFFTLTGLSVLIAIQNEVNSDPLKYFHTTVPIRKAYDFTEDKIDGLRGVELVFDSGKKDGIKDPIFLKKLERFIQFIEVDPQITRVRSLLNVIKRMNQALNQDDSSFYKIPESQEIVAELLFLYSMGLPSGLGLNHQYTLDQRYLRIKVSWNISTSKEGEAKTYWLEDQAKKFYLNAKTGGNAPIYLSMNTLVVKSFSSSMTMALSFVGLLILLVYRNFFVSILAMFPNIIPLCFGGALMQILGKPIDIGTSIVSTVCLGIAVDDTIHFISSYRQYRESGLEPIEAIENTFQITGKALIITTVLLVVGFGSFVFAEFVPNRNFGILCSLILFLALVTDLIFLPALLLVIDKKSNKIF